jgi:eukaryotic-like serine/threonine-protein kinase
MAKAPAAAAVALVPMARTPGQPRVILGRKNAFFTISSSIAASDNCAYQVGEKLGEGGNAVVHECIESVSGDVFAVKFQLALQGKRRERFGQEVELLKALHDPHIIAYVADGSVKGDMEFKTNKGHRNPRQITKVDIPFVILPRASENLAQHVKAKAPIPEATYLGQILGLSKALIKVNAMALHRDIKPENVLVVGDTWAISDFGLCDKVMADADLSMADEMIGPIFWMSPEALNRRLGCADVICEASDVFQMASIFWYAVCGRHPSGMVVAADWKGPAELFPVIHKALLHTTADRFATSEDFHNALRSVIGTPA